MKTRCSGIINLITKMSGQSNVFKSKVNPITGKAEWIVGGEDHDFYQEIARSAYADMLHDQERNIMFRQALERVIRKQKAEHKRVHVLDIGTGTGLLAMLAARFGADRVTACEAFMPMAITAEKIIKQNGFTDRIRVIKHRSTDMVESDMSGDRANVCVAEVFDTELIGEGALRTFYEATQSLLEKNATVIPSSAVVFAQLVQSDTALNWDKPRPIVLPEFGVNIQPPLSCAMCSGAAAVHDLQLEQFPKECFQRIGEPVPVFREHSAHLVHVPDQCDATQADAVFMWWQLDMDGSGELLLSTSPSWASDRPVQWRDHWMQAIYYLPQSVAINPSTAIILHAYHDEYSLWFAAGQALSNKVLKTDEQCLVPRPVCTCGLHMVCSRTNLGRFNDRRRYAAFAAALVSLVPGRSVVCTSDCSLLPLVALQCGAIRVVSIQSNPMAARIIQEYGEANGCGDRLMIINKSNDEVTAGDLQQPDVVLADPFYFSAMLPWHNLYFWYSLVQWRKSGVIGKETCCLPSTASLWCLPVQFEHLWKIRAPLGRVEGCDLGLFDNVVQKAMQLTDGRVEAHALWEYPSVALGNPVCLLTLNMADDLPAEYIRSEDQISFTGGSCNAVVLWMEWQIPGAVISTGLIKPCCMGERPMWDWHTTQGVYFLPLSNSEAGSLKSSLVFNAHDGDINVDFQRLDD